MIIVIPARGGSKRIPGKNIAPLNGKPLLTYTIECALAADTGFPIYVSSEDPAILDITQNYPVAIHNRPAELAQDITSTEAVLLDVIEKHNQPAEWVITLAPTSPFRTPKTLKACIAAAQAAPDNIDCIMTVTENRGDFWRYDQNKNFGRLFPDAPRRQQEREPLFEENGTVYISRISALKEKNIVLGRGGVLPIPNNYPEWIDINTPDDLNLAEAIMKTR